MDNLWQTAKPVEIPKEALQQTLSNHHESSFLEALVARTQQAPFMIAGIVGFTTVCGIGIYKWRTRKIPAQLFLIQLRVAAQSTALGCIGLGMLHQMYESIVHKKEDK